MSAVVVVCVLYLEMEPRVRKGGLECRCVAAAAVVAAATGDAESGIDLLPPIFLCVRSAR